ncbi:hypothetical protein R1flu_007123 [Riccia fluitans]|uniref:ATP synthase protein MI25 n=1 Tax=Riccia fluitans TaxID=41844 RepID=A0ABD1YY01_9MARC
MYSSPDLARRQPRLRPLRITLAYIIGLDQRIIQGKAENSENRSTLRGSITQRSVCERCVILDHYPGRTGFVTGGEQRSVFRSQLQRTIMSPTPLQTFSVVAGFSALSAWYGYMFGKEAARKELGAKINELRDENSKLKNAIDSIK